MSPARHLKPNKKPIINYQTPPMNRHANREGINTETKTRSVQRDLMQVVE